MATTKTNASDDTAIVTVRLTNEVKEQFEKDCDFNNDNMSNVLRKSIEQYRQDTRLKQMDLERKGLLDV